MKNNLLKTTLYLTFTCFCTIAYCQQSRKSISTLLDIEDNEDTIYVVPNTRFPSPIIGYDSLINYFNRYLERYYIKDFKNDRAIVEFIVEKDGSLSHVRVVEGLGINVFEDSIAVKAVASLPWNPGLQDSIPVRTYCRVPVWF